MNIDFAIIQNILVSLTSGVILFGLAIFYFKIWRTSKNIERTNVKIEEQQKELESIELENIKSDFNMDIDLSDNKEEKQKIQKMKNAVEKLKREKQYYLELISIYNIFKK